MIIKFCVVGLKPFWQMANAIKNILEIGGKSTKNCKYPKTKTTVV